MEIQISTLGFSWFRFQVVDKVGYIDQWLVDTKMVPYYNCPRIAKAHHYRDFRFMPNIFCITLT